MGTKDDVDFAWVRFREDFGYQKALNDVFDLGWTRPNEDVVSMDLVKLDEPWDQNWWSTRERVFVDDVDTERHLVVWILSTVLYAASGLKTTLRRT